MPGRVTVRDSRRTRALPYPGTLRAMPKPLNLRSAARRGDDNQPPSPERFPDVNALPEYS